MPVVLCPQCSTRYNIPDAHLQPAGRTLKCAKCGNRWFEPNPFAPPAPEPLADVLPPEQDSALPPVAEEPAGAPSNEPLADAPPVAPPALDALASEGFPLKRLTRRVTGGFGVFWWLAGGILLLFLAAVAWVMMDFVAPAPPHAAFMPPEIPANQPANLRVEKLEPRLYQQGNVPMLDMDGILTNTGPVSVTVPEFRVQLLDTRGVVLDFWPAEVSSTTMAPGDSQRFVVHFRNPPLERMVAYRAFFDHAKVLHYEVGVSATSAISASETVGPESLSSATEPLDTSEKHK